MAEEKKDHISGWTDMWAKGQAPWHLKAPHWLLESSWNVVTGGRSGLRVFIPLCGKTIDMAWLVERGHTVVGVEIATEAVEEFMTENNYTFKVITKSLQGQEVKVYQVNDKPISIYQCDIFKFSRELECGFDVIWDRGSLEAINPSQRPEYVTMIKGILEETGIYLLSTLNYDKTLNHTGPPYSLPLDDVKSIYDGIYDTELFLEDSGDVVRAKEIDIPRFYLPVICASTYKDLESRI